MLEAKTRPGEAAYDRRSRRPDAAQDLPTIGNFRIQLVGDREAEHFEAQWRDLAGRALEANIFAEPAYALAAAHHLADDGKPLFLLAWDAQRNGAPEQLHCVFPIQAPTRGFVSSRIKVWHSKYSGMGTPLVDRDRSREVLEAVFGWLARNFPSNQGILFPHIAREGAFARLLLAFAEANTCYTRVFDEHQRAVLAPNAVETEFLAETMRGKKLKELRRQRRRLAERGVLTERSVRDRRGLREAFEYFLALEASGWKGKRGTAMMFDPSVAAFARTAIRKWAAMKACRIDLIEIDGRPVAAGIILKSGSKSWYWKTAYDAELARYSPGVLLTLDITRRQLASKTVELTDSCAVENHPMIDHLWPDRRTMIDLFVATDADHRPGAVSVATREAMRRSIRRRLKSALMSLTGRPVR